jgi:ABC-type tungstate transport system permease subunit
MAKKIKFTIASTTSTKNSGLFDILIPAYEKPTQYNVSIEIIAVGTGKAIRIAKKGDADMLFVHDPFREDKFPNVTYREAMDFIAFVTSREGQRLISKYKKHGVNLFYPDAVPTAMTSRK